MFKQMQSAAKVALAAASLAALTAQAAPFVSTNVYSENFNLATGWNGINGTTASWTFSNGTATAAGSQYAFIGQAPAADSTVSLGNGPFGPVSLAAVSAGTGGFLAVDAAYNYHGMDVTNSAYSFSLQKAFTLAAGWYTVSFDYAASNELGRAGTENNWWDVSFNGSTILSTAQLLTTSTATSGTATGWSHATATFYADGGANEFLSFLAKSTGSENQPPFVLLDNLSIDTAPVPAPEPAMLGLVGLGLAGLGFIRRKQQRG